MKLHKYIYFLSIASLRINCYIRVSEKSQLGVRKIWQKLKILEKLLPSSRHQKNSLQDNINEEIEG